MVSFSAPVVPLFVPGSRPERFAKADASGADAVILDLEDAVAPLDKDRARDAIVAEAATLKSSVIVRINAAGTSWHHDDLDALRGLDGICIMLPKAEDAADIAAMTSRIGRDLSVIALVESAKGLSCLSHLLDAPAVVAVAFGSIDFSLDLGCADDRLALLAARSEIVWRSRAANRSAPIDGVTTNFANPEIVEADARHAMELGFGGKMAIHPRQIDPIWTSFLPNRKETEWARSILAVAASGEAAQVNGQMVDCPIVERARRIVHRAGSTQRA